MGSVLSKAGRAALRAVIPVALTLGVALLGAKSVDDLRLQATVGICALLAAAVGALQEFVPQLSFAAYSPEFGKYIDAFVQAFVGTLLTLSLSILAAPDTAFGLAAWTAAIVGALTAAVRAVQALLTPGENPAPNTGVRPLGSKA